MALQSKLAIRTTESTVRSIRSTLTWQDRQCPLIRRRILPTYLKKRFDRTTWFFAYGLILSTIPSGTAGRNKGVDAEATRLRSEDRSDVDMADCPWRNPWKDVLPARRPGNGIRSSPRRTAGTPAAALLMVDQSEIGLGWSVLRLHWQLSHPSKGYLPRYSEHVQRFQILLQRRSAKLGCRQADLEQ